MIAFGTRLSSSTSAGPVKTFARFRSHILAALGTVVLPSCDRPAQNEPPPPQTQLVDAKRESKSPLPEGQLPSQAPDIEKILSNARIVVASEHPKQAAQVIRDLPYYHDPKVCAAMIEMLQQHMAKLPAKLPSLAEVQAMETAGGTHPELWAERWFSDYSKVANLLFCLVELGFPEGITAAENAYQQLASQWGDTEASKPLLNALRTAMDHSHRVLKQGTAGWQLSPNAPIRRTPLHE
jgi:hypothetical protein